jgi:hypothetical protein
VAYQVTATEGANSVNGVLLRVKVLTGAAAAAAQTGATKIADTGTTPFYDQSITTTVTGSVVYGAMADGNTAFSMTADARTTLLDNFADNTQGCQYSTWRATSATGSPGATTLGATSPGGGEHGTYAAAEILASGTITEDASSPAVATTTAATSVQSAAFTPPPGSLLVALVAHCSSGVSSITITNNGGALTWVQRAYESTSGGTGAGVWIAQVPAASGWAPGPQPEPGWFPGAPAMPGGPAFAPWPPLPEIAPGPDPAPPPGTEPPPPPLPLPPAFPGFGLPGMPGGTAFEPWPPPPQEVSSPPLPAHDYITGLAGVPGAGYFVDERGNPRMVLGDAVWGLPGNAGRWSSGNWQGDFDTYVSTRAGQGFSVIYTKPMGTTQNGGINDDGRVFDGLFPFQGGTLANPSTGLTAAYWARIDYFLNSALAQGLTVFLNAIGYDSDFETSGPLAGKSSTEFGSYGSQLGARYASQPNLIWMVADDYFGGATDTKISAFLTGLRAAGANQPISIENFPETTSRQDTSSGSATAWGASNAQFNWSYSYNVTYFGIEKAYAEASPIPVITGDGYFYQGSSSYAGGSGAFAYDRAIRQDAWHAISSGARGIIHGDEATWQWQSTAQAAAAANWYQVHNAGNIRALMESLPSWHLLLPDASSVLVTAGRGTHATGFTSGGGGGQYEVAFTDSYVTASRTPSGDLAVIYLSHATSITIDQSKMTAGYAAFWVDPITGVKTGTSSGTTYNSAIPGSNSQGDPDWVLVLQAATATAGSASLSGTGTLTAGPKLAATASLSGSGSLTAAAASGATATLSGLGTLSVSGVTLGTGAALSGTGTLSAAPQLQAAASLSGLGTLTAGPALTGAAVLSGLGTLSTSPVLGASASLSGSGTLTASPAVPASASLTGTGTLSTAWTLRATVALSGSGTLSYAQGQAAASLSGTGTLSAAPALSSAAALSGTGTLTAPWALTLAGAAAMSGQGTLTAALRLGLAAALSGTGTLTALVHPPLVRATSAPLVTAGATSTPAVTSSGWGATAVTSPAASAPSVS